MRYADTTSPWRRYDHRNRYYSCFRHRPYDAQLNEDCGAGQADDLSLLEDDDARRNYFGNILSQHRSNLGLGGVIFRA